MGQCLANTQHELHAYKQCSVATEKKDLIVCYPFKRAFHVLYEDFGQLTLETLFLP